MKYSVFIICCTIFISDSLAQSSFQKRIVSDNGLSVSIVQDNGNGFILGRQLSAKYSILRLDSLGNPTMGFKYNNSTIATLEDIAADSQGNITALFSISQNNKLRLILLKIAGNGDLLWDKALQLIDANDARQLLMVENGSNFVVSSNSDAIFTCLKIDMSGDIEWSKTIESSNASLSDLVFLSSGNYAILAYSSGPSSVDHKTILQTVLPDGNLSWSRSFLGLYPLGIDAFANGSFLISGQTTDQRSVIIKSDPSGQILWAKQLPGFLLLTEKAKVASNENQIFAVAYHTFQTITALKMDENGDYLWAKVYPSNSNSLTKSTPTQDGGMAIAGYIIGNTGLESTLMKLNEHGLSGGCPFYNLCIENDTYPINVESANWWPGNSILIDTMINGELLKVTAFTEDHCYELQVPSPQFEVPDTICIESCIKPSNLNQMNANAWHWYFEGGAPESSNMQHPGEICFNQSGMFEVQHAISFGGCWDTFTTIVHVLPSPILNIGTDTLVCEDSPIEIDALASGANEYFWNDGDVNHKKLISKGGTYSVSASNGYCYVSDSIEVRFLSEILNIETLDLGNDTVLCKEAQLFLNAHIEGGTSYLWDDGFNGQERSVSITGNYKVEVNFENCILTDSISVDFQHCESKVYIPNAFSPNHDGINDVFQVFGEDILVNSLKIFDRWGGIVFESNDENNIWDGTQNGKPCLPGTYTFLAQVFDLKLNRLENLSGNILLCR